VVLGHPGYYRKFGFRTASDFWIECGYDVPKEMFMLREMSNNALVTRQNWRGTISTRILIWVVESEV